MTMLKPTPSDNVGNGNIRNINVDNVDEPHLTRSKQEFPSALLARSPEIQSCEGKVFLFILSVDLDFSNEKFFLPILLADLDLSFVFRILPMSAERPRVKARTRYSFQSNLKRTDSD